PRSLAELLTAEHHSVIRVYQFHLVVLRLQHALQSSFNVFNRLVNNRVVANVDALAVGQLANTLSRSNVEPKDDRVIDSRQVNVVLRDGTHTTVDDSQRDIVANINLE